MNQGVLWSKQRAHVADGTGNSRFLDVGEVVQADDPIVKMYPSMFTEDGTLFMRGPVSQRATEAATAEPGEKRATKQARPQE